MNLNIGIGTKYGDYTVISELFYSFKLKQKVVKCKCKCDKIIEVAPCKLHLLNMCKQCYKFTTRKYSIGDRVNNWTVLEYKYYPDTQKTAVVVQCVCGTIKECAAADVKTKQGCRICHAKRNIQYNNKFYKGTKNIPNSYFTSIKQAAKLRNLEFDITIEYIDELLAKQQFECYYTGIKIVVPQRKRIHSNLETKNFASLDRIDSNIGYIKGNVHWVHQSVNFMKHSLTHNEFLYFIKMIYKKHVQLL